MKKNIIYLVMTIFIIGITVYTLDARRKTTSNLRDYKKIKMAKGFKKGVNILCASKNKVPGANKEEREANASSFMTKWTPKCQTMATKAFNRTGCDGKRVAHFGYAGPKVNWHYVDKYYPSQRDSVNNAIENSKGDWLFILSDDDIILDGFLKNIDFSKLSNNSLFSGVSSRFDNST